LVHLPSALSQGTRPCLGGHRVAYIGPPPLAPSDASRAPNLISSLIREPFPALVPSLLRMPHASWPALTASRCSCDCHLIVKAQPRALCSHCPPRTAAGIPSLSLLLSVSLLLSLSSSSSLSLSPLHSLRRRGRQAEVVRSLLPVSPLPASSLSLQLFAR
jgi:hypothetical protein